MQFEFQESDVVFGDRGRRRSSSYEEEGRGASSDCNPGKSRKIPGQGGSSPPVDIPRDVRGSSLDLEDCLNEGEGGDDEGEMVPPHVIVDRRRTASGRGVACSVCFSHGRTLKGRYLSEVRNSILRMTGFLES
ncbi:hypothetical protein MLD38_027597 [Melastoma candidum]|uniref:Uncharacterized protein n=1 Tax=Melastoma candidum TaxID=119954 RepID=A0ACB9P238_9MYRT|nr:hypothetical protein MLD38_027597 [Melastoma candidum]